MDVTFVAKTKKNWKQIHLFDKCFQIHEGLWPQSCFFFFWINHACEGNIDHWFSHQAFGVQRKDHGCSNSGPNFPSQCTYKPKCHRSCACDTNLFCWKFSTLGCPIVMLSSSRFSKVSSSKMIALHLRWCEAKAIVGFLLEFGFIFVGGTLGIIDLENPGSNFFLNICSLVGVLFLGQSRYHPHCSKWTRPQSVAMWSLYIVDDEFGSILSMYNLGKPMMTPRGNNMKLKYLLHKQPKEI